ncbi:MAG: ATP-binding protein [Deltaproteobacteria bacterium]|jgi:hypothetical protein|nr:ATP-binding protein [Deltaproteobacteria bacterium]
MFFNRIILSHLEEALKYFPIVLLTGARQVGKSTLSAKIIENYITFDDINIYVSATTDPVAFVENLKKPVVLDEIQKIPQIFETIKYDVDKNRVNGSYLLTGSANVIGFKKTTDTLAGRIALLELYPLSMKELSDKNENIIDILFDDIYLDYKNDKFNDLKYKYNEIINQVILGGYPEIRNINSLKGRHIWFSSYISTYIERDVRDIGELRNLDKFIKMFNILSSRSANILNKTDLSKDTGIDNKTLDNYLKLLEAVYQIYFLNPYSANINKRFVKSQKLFFTDSGVLSHLLGVSKVEDFKDSPYKGIIFETFIFSELLKSVKYSMQNTKLFFYRTTDKKEIDFIIERNQKIIAAEVKLSQTITLSDFKHIIDLKKSSKNFKAGFIFYSGENVLSFGIDLFALPVKILF